MWGKKARKIRGNMEKYEGGRRSKILKGKKRKRRKGEGDTRCLYNAKNVVVIGPINNN